MTLIMTVYNKEDSRCFLRFFDDKMFKVPETNEYKQEPIDLPRQNNYESGEILHLSMPQLFPISLFLYHFVPTADVFGSCDLFVQFLTPFLADFLKIK